MNNNTYENFQLQWMIDNGYSLMDLMNELENYRMDNPESGYWDFKTIFKEWEIENGFGGFEIWSSKSEWEKKEDKNEEPEQYDFHIPPRFYKFTFRFWAQFSLGNSIMSKEAFVNFAERKLKLLPKKFSKAQLNKVDYDFNSMQFYADIQATTSIAFCVEHDENFIEVFKEAMAVFCTCENGNEIGLTNIWVDYEDAESINDLSDEALKEISEREAKCFE